MTCLKTHSTCMVELKIEVKVMILGRILFPLKLPVDFAKRLNSESDDKELSLLGCFTLLQVKVSVAFWILH